MSLMNFSSIDESEDSSSATCFGLLIEFLMDLRNPINGYYASDIFVL